MINYSILQDSVTHYEKCGFQRIESPWTVSEGVLNITRPGGAELLQLKHNDKCLVASGEQSFLYLYLKGFVPLGAYQTITPCFRSDYFDALHSKYFIKNELIQTDDVSKAALYDMIADALDFFQKYIPDARVLTTGTDTYDIITSDNQELGSYGIRHCTFLSWIYGTGCAEPRLSTLANRNQPQYNYGLSSNSNTKRHSWRVLQNRRGIPGTAGCSPTK